MTGHLLVALGAALVASTAVAVARALPLRSVTAVLLAAYVIGWSEIVLVLLALSPFRWLTPAGVLSSFGAVAAAALLATRGRTFRSFDARLTLADARAALADPLLAVLAVAVAAALCYAVVLTVATPQNDFDTIYDHLWRAGLWVQRGAIGYPDCSCAPYINAYPPHGEMGSALTMVLAGSDRYVAIPQSLGFVALAVGVLGIGRRVGLTQPQALFGSLLCSTLPVVALQASSAQNDLLVASFLVAGTVFLLDGSPVAPWLAGGSIALALGTKVSAPFALPLLVAIVLLGRPRGRRLARLAAIAVGTAAGSYWYVVNRAETGSLTGGFPEIPVDHGSLASISRVMRFGIELVDLSGARGRDLLLYVVAAAVVAGVVGVAGRGRPRAAVVGAAFALAIGFAPVVLADVQRLLERTYVKLWTTLGRDDLAYVDIGRDIRRSASNFSWYGPLGSLLLVGAVVAVVLAVRRGQIDRLALLFALAPAYWLVAFGVTLYYQDFAGRFFMFAIALASATWGLALTWRPVAWGLAAIAVTAVALALLNDTKRPSGLRLLEPDPPRSYFETPRWAGQGTEIRWPGLVRFVDDRVPDDAAVALAITPSDPGYIFFGPGLDRTLRLVDPSVTDVPGATWAFFRPGVADHLCGSAWRRLPDRPQDWVVLRRVGTAPCS